jgi:hypothetical protein
LLVVIFYAGQCAYCRYRTVTVSDYSGALLQLLHTPTSAPLVLPAPLQLLLRTATLISHRFLPSRAQLPVHHSHAHGKRHSPSRSRAHSLIRHSPSHSRAHSLIRHSHSHTLQRTLTSLPLRLTDSLQVSHVAAYRFATGTWSALGAGVDDTVGSCRRPYLDKYLIFSVFEAAPLCELSTMSARRRALSFLRVALVQGLWLWGGWSSPACGPSLEDITPTPLQFYTIQRVMRSSYVGVILRRGMIVAFGCWP